MKEMDAIVTIFAVLFPLALVGLATIGAGIIFLIQSMLA